MIDPTNLILLDKEETELVLKMAIRRELDVYIITTTNMNMPFLLKVGDLENIRRAIPQRTEIMLEPPRPGAVIGRFERVGYEDLRILQSKYDVIFKEKQKGTPEIEKEINEKERSSLYKMILGMAMGKYNYNPMINRNLATGANKGSIKEELEKHGLFLDEETIRTYLQEAFEMHKAQMKK